MNAANQLNNHINFRVVHQIMKIAGGGGIRQVQLRNFGLGVRHIQITNLLHVQGKAPVGNQLTVLSQQLQSAAAHRAQTNQANIHRPCFRCLLLCILHFIINLSY